MSSPPLSTKQQRLGKRPLVAGAHAQLDVAHLADALGHPPVMLPRDQGEVGPRPAGVADVVNPVPEGGGEQPRADQALRGQVLSELSRDDDPVHRIRRQPRRLDQAEGPGQDGPLGQLDLAHVLLRQDQGRVPLTKDEAPHAHQHYN